MLEQKRPILRFVSGSEEPSRQVAIDYWRGHYDGNRWIWDQSVDQVVTSHGVKRKDITSIVRATSTSFDESISCIKCAAHKELTSRSDFVAKNYGDYICFECRRRRAEEVERERQEQELAIRSAKIAVLEKLSGKDIPYDYGSIGYTAAILVYAILLASDHACETGEFGDSANLHLCPTDKLSGELLKQLSDTGILQISRHTPLSAIEIKDEGGWSANPHRIRWKFARDVNGVTFPQLMTRLGAMIDSREEYLSYRQSVKALWWMLAVDDVSRFLLQAVTKYRLPDYRKGAKTEEALRYALEHYSIPQVRRHIQIVTEKAAAYSVTRDVNSRRALNTIPGNLISRVDRALSEQWTIYPLLDDWTNEEPILLTVLFNRVLGTGLPGFKTLSGTLLKELEPSPVT
ncbi:hypothetical protein [Granulicella sp. dw_53]|uniref:hypothetical protein n=1 Tax=Granulicella sp. dw_53 TaxID=2719792 RepID=UPI001BD3CF78|nr:hypothetical protein [Granulicella sp. dw_53]